MPVSMSLFDDSAMTKIDLNGPAHASSDHGEHAVCMRSHVTCWPGIPQAQGTARAALEGEQFAKSREWTSPITTVVSVGERGFEPLIGWSRIRSAKFSC